MSREDSRASGRAGRGARGGRSQGSAAGGRQEAASASPRTSGRGTDRDLPLKVGIRRLLWRMGCSTRLDVRLLAYVPPERGQASAQDLTDLDVLGFGFTPGGQLHTTFADCRSSERRALERMFWVRGVADFVAADDAYLVRAHAVPAAGRTLAARLGIGILTPEDFTAMERTFPADLDLSGALGCLFDLEAVGRHLDAHNDADKKLEKLLHYLQFDYWILEPYRNLTQLAAHLADAVAILDPGNRRHRTLFYDCAWHYALAVTRAAGFVRSTRMGAVPVAVQTYVGGGEHTLREKAGLARLLQSVGAPVDVSAVHPPYMDLLTELINRYLVRPAETAEVLRYAEYLAVAEVNRVDATVAAAFGAHVSPVAAKLVADTCGFLVTAAGLRPEFRAHARERLVVDLTGGAPVPAEELAARDRFATGDALASADATGSPGSRQLPPTSVEPQDGRASDSRGEETLPLKGVDGPDARQNVGARDGAEGRAPDGPHAGEADV